LRSTQQTALYVTHDQEEAFSLADRVIVMDQGNIAQIGTPQEIYQQPASEFVARFLGMGNILKGEIQNGILKTEIGDFKIGDGFLREADQTLAVPSSVNIPILIRPEKMRLDGSGTQQVNGIMLEVRFRGNFCRSTVQIGNKTLVFEFPSTAPIPQIGNSVVLSFNPEEAIQILK
jgi:ABC-type Fe3+/spermidine/putrescine transport system ATPase subunit